MCTVCGKVLNSESQLSVTIWAMQQKKMMMINIYQHRNRYFGGYFLSWNCETREMDYRTPDVVLNEAEQRFPAQSANRQMERTQSPHVHKDIQKDSNTENKWTCDHSSYHTTTITQTYIN